MYLYSEFVVRSFVELYIVTAARCVLAVVTENLFT